MLVLLVTVSLLLSHSADGRATPAVKTIHAADGRASPVKTIHSEDGDVIDCVDIFSQPSLQHPLLKDHVIQLKPGSYPKGFERFDESLSRTQRRSEPLQVWQKSSSCPDGTIPILRQKLPSNDQAGILHSSTNSKKYDNSSSLLDYNDGVSFSREHAITKPTDHDGSGFTGAAASMNVWNPFLESPEEFTNVRIALQAQGSNGLENIFAGYHVHQNLYGDRETRLFLDWMAAGHSCYNLDCPGFIQIDQSYALGGQLSVSSYEGNQVNMDVTIYKDPVSSDWWLGINGIRLGYMPAELFSSMRHSATYLDFGGEVMNRYPEGRHTKTQMGSGYFPGPDTQSVGKAAYFAYVDFLDGHGQVSPIREETTVVTKPNCYNFQVLDISTISGYAFFFGGPGGSEPNCN